MKQIDSIVILGPTASGKTKLAVQLAAKLNSEILSIDSRMVYKQLDIGTGKDLDEYIYENKAIPYHLIDVCEPQNNYHIYQFQQAFKTAFDVVRSKNKTPILCGGSGMYLDAVINDFTYTSIPGNKLLQEKLEALELTQLQEKFHQLDVHSFKEIADLGSKKRAIRALLIANFLLKNPSYELVKPKPLQPITIGLNPPIQERRNNITKRLNQRIQNGLIEEVENLLNAGISVEKMISLGLEYKFVTRYLLGELNKENMLELLGIAIQQFAKRQMTYFRKMEKSGLVIHWIKSEDEALDLLQKHHILI
jgi:tRNA dimethylallyltransferase